MVKYFEIETKIPFAESLIWQLNRNFYQDKSIAAWSNNTVPHQMTSNSQVGKTYAQLIFGILKDLATKGQIKERVYILELGAGHGRLCYHVLQHLSKLVNSVTNTLPPFCYVLSDIVEGNLSFFKSHPQLQRYYKSGQLDYAYFDAVEGKELYLRHAEKTIKSQDLEQPILAIGNYFFDSIPNELFFIKDKIISTCSLSVHSKENPQGMDSEKLLDQMVFTFHHDIAILPLSAEPIQNEILEEYRESLSHTHLLFPKLGMQCLQKLKAFSSAGLVLLTMDKGFHELHNLSKRKEPEIIKHGSMSVWTNYHALSAYCTKSGGKALFPKFSNFHLEIGCLMFLADGESYTHTNAAYEEVVNNFGPDDFNTIKKMAYSNVSRLKVIDFIAMIRLSNYDSTFFTKLLPRFKQAAKHISKNERVRIGQTLERVWEMYFSIDESFDLAYELGGMLYDLAYYEKALVYFQYSVDRYGQKEDTFYNQALCHYQMKEDILFYKSLNEFKDVFPDYKLIAELEGLDMG